MRENYIDTSGQELQSGILLQNRYLLDKIIGRGGFGLIWLAHDKKLNIPVAIKEYLLQSELSKKDLYREGQMSARFFDQDAVAIGRDYFIERNHFYIVLNYVDGININEYIFRFGRMHGGEVLQKMRPIITTIGKIHEQNIIHRDISADNLMMTKDKKIKLIDFGTARRMEDYIDKTYTQNSKYGFTPIEQYEESGVYGKQGPWTDIYSLCATIYYMITGNVPKLSVLRMIHDSIKSLSQIPDTGLSSHQTDCIMKGLAVNPEDRYQSISEFYKDLYETEWEEKTIEEPENSKNNHKKMVISLAVCAALVTSSILLYSQKNSVPLPTTSQDPTGQAIAATGSDSVVSENAIYTAPIMSENKSTPEPEKTYMIGNYKGMDKRSVKKKTKKLAKEGLKIIYKEKYSDQVAKGTVISQKPAAGKEYKDLSKASLILVMSKGSKPVPTPKPTPASTRKPVAIPSAKPTPNKKDSVEFSGNLDDIPE